MGLRALLRQDPNIIMIGEIRDKETAEEAVHAAMTGHVVFSTLHTNSASQTVDRIIDSFPEAQQNQVRIQLASTLEAVVSQRLVPTIESGRVAATEVLIATNAIRSNIREGKTHLIDSIIETSYEEGMNTIESSLAKLVQDGYITLDTAQAYALRPETLARLLS
jgi:twitching motility protein PilT